MSVWRGHYGDGRIDFCGKCVILECATVCEEELIFLFYHLCVTHTVPTASGTVPDAVETVTKRARSKNFGKEKRDVLPVLEVSWLTTSLVFEGSCMLPEIFN